mmetsp:Transcript_11001/g.30385  ORF Transcript_11001/g.30385 Transcript_11001/m.30385 type:complete len:376 (-) Transcript_11001:40-1167(-)
MLQTTLIMNGITSRYTKQLRQHFVARSLHQLRNIQGRATVSSLSSTSSSPSSLSSAPAPFALQRLSSCVSISTSTPQRAAVSAAALRFASSASDGSVHYEYFVDTTGPTSSPFLPIHFYKDSHASQSDVLDKIEAMMQHPKNVRGMLLSQPKYPRDFRNMKALRAVMPPHLSVFYEESITNYIAKQHRNAGIATEPSSAVAQDRVRYQAQLPDEFTPLYTIPPMETEESERLKRVLMQQSDDAGGSVWIKLPIDSGFDPIAQTPLMSPNFGGLNESARRCLEMFQACDVDINLWVTHFTQKADEGIEEDRPTRSHTHAMELCRYLVESGVVKASQLIVPLDSIPDDDRSDEGSMLKSHLDVGIRRFTVQDRVIHL